MTTLLLVRHGETEWNQERRLQGQADAALTRRGRQQVLALRDMLLEFSADHVVSSDLTRATETARLLGWDRPVLDERWREADLGEWTGRHTDELAALDGRYQRWREGRYTPANAESFDELSTRVREAIDELPDRGTVIAVTHGGTIRAVLNQLVDLSPNVIVPPSLGSLTILDLNGSPRLQAYNITGSIPPADSPD